jgi:hypothetical protein
MLIEDEHMPPSSNDSCVPKHTLFLMLIALPNWTKLRTLIELPVRTMLLTEVVDPID